MTRLLLCFALYPVAVCLAQEPVTPSTAPLSASAQPAAVQNPPATPLQTTPAQPERNPDGTYTIRTNARLVVLDLIATDKQGNVVTDLKKEDFHVTEQGDPENILYFQQPGAFPPPADATINSTEDLDRLAPRAPVNIVLLDEFNTRFEDMAFARYSFKKLLERQPEKLTTPTILIAVSMQNFTVLHDYTEDKAALITALDHHFAAYPWQVHQYAWVGERFATAFFTLRRVAEATAGHPGHKNMIWIGRGFPAFSVAGADLDAQRQIDSAVQRCVNTLRDARITLYTVDPAGVQIDPNMTYGNGGGFPSVAADPFGGNYQFSALARATGGKALYGRNDVDVEIGTAIREGASFYTLTYRPENTSTDPRQFRRIKVTVDRPGVQVLTREGYYLSRRAAPVNPEKPSRMLLADLGSAAMSTMVYDGLELRVTPQPGTPSGYVVHVSPKGLTWSNATDDQPRTAEVVFVAVAFDKKGKVLEQVAKSITSKAPDTVQPTGRIERGLDLNFAFQPNPKAVRGRFVVREGRTGRIGTADVTFVATPRS